MITLYITGFIIGMLVFMWVEARRADGFLDTFENTAKGFVVGGLWPLIILIFGLRFVIKTLKFRR